MGGGGSEEHQKERGGNVVWEVRLDTKASANVFKIEDQGRDHCTCSCGGSSELIQPHPLRCCIMVQSDWETSQLQNKLGHTCAHTDTHLRLNVHRWKCSSAAYALNLSF